MRAEDFRMVLQKKSTDPYPRALSHWRINLHEFRGRIDEPKIFGVACEKSMCHFLSYRVTLCF